MGRLKLKPLPENLGANTLAAVPLALVKVSVPALPPIELLLRFRSMSPEIEVLLVAMVLSAVRSIGLATGAVLAARVALVSRVPPERCSAPVASPNVELALPLI